MRGSTVNAEHIGCRSEKVGKKRVHTRLMIYLNILNPTIELKNSLGKGWNLCLRTKPEKGLRDGI